MVKFKPLFKMVEQDQKQPNNLEKEFNNEVNEAELDQATIDTFLLEHPGVSETAARQALSKIKREEKKEENKKEK